MAKAVKNPEDGSVNLTGWNLEAAAGPDELIGKLHDALLQFTETWREKFGEKLILKGAAEALQIAVDDGARVELRSLFDGTAEISISLGLDGGDVGPELKVPLRAVVQETIERSISWGPTDPPFLPCLRRELLALADLITDEAIAAERDLLEESS